MKNLLVDISRAVRSVRSHPVTSLVIAATVAIGIAAGATVFSIADTLLLRSLPGVVRQSELVNVHAMSRSTRGTARGWMTFALVLLLLALVAISATYLPSRSAARIDPMTALRSE